MVKKFELDPNEFVEGRDPIDRRFPGEPRPLQALEDIELAENPLLEKAGDVASSMLSGEIPLDVQQEIERITAEKSLQSGIGMGQASRNLTARDLGVTSFDIQQRGLSSATDIAELESRNALTLAQINSQRQQFNEEINLRAIALREEMRQWDDRFFLMTQEHDLNVDRLSLMGAELISTNQRFMQDIVARMVISNSQIEIPGLQENINQLGEFFNTTNRGIADILDLEIG